MAHTAGNGPITGVLKYDVLTALSVFGLNGTAGDQISMCRLATLLTARYNWQRQELSMGQAEMGRLWGIGERTVKREVKRWLSTGLVICRQPGARGRVARYHLNIPRLCELTEPIWHLVGPDFAERMQALKPSTAQVIRLDSSRETVSNTGSLAGWDAVSATLCQRFPAQHAAWIAPLTASQIADTLCLEATSVFAAEYAATHFGRDIVDAVASEMGPRIEVVIKGPSSHRKRL